MTPSEDAVGVLVPDDLGVRVLASVPELTAIPFDPALPPSADQLAARAIVLDYPDDIRPTLEFMRALPRLQFAQTLSAGYEQWVGRLPAGVRLSNARGTHGLGVAEWVAAVLLAQVRDLAGFAASQRQGAWRRHPTGSLLDLRVTVLGAGDIGTRTRALLEPFGCRVRLVGAHSRDGVITLDEFRADAGDDDVVVLALPVTRETTRIVDAGFLALLKDGAIVVNAGRGALVDTGALAAEAASGRLVGILDVVDPEPLPDGDPLWSTPGITITPHIGGAIPGVWDRAWVAALADLRSFAAGEPPRDLAVAP